jgi:hypothetical protein
VLIIPSSWVSQLDGELHHQHRAASIVFTTWCVAAMYSINGSFSLGATNTSGVEITFFRWEKCLICLFYPLDFFPISSSVRRTERLFCQVVRWIDSALLPFMLVDVSCVALWVSPLLILLEFSLGWPQSLLLILKIQGVALLGHQRNI